MNSQKWFKSESGLHCITTGMRYFGIDILSNNFNEDDKFKIELRDKEVRKWNIICKDKPSLLQFLKDNIHKDA
jgi:hypothetical protein